MVEEPETLPVIAPPRSLAPTVIAKPKTVAAIARAVAAVMAEVGHVSKQGYNNFHRYKYATMENVLQKVTPLLAKHGLAIIQSEIRREMFDDGKVIAIEYAFTILHSSGEVWPERPVQSGMCRCRDSKGGFDDKALNKCHTSVRKYFLLALFQIPTGDEDDNDGEAQPVRRVQREPVPPHDKSTGEIIEDEIPENSWNQKMDGAELPGTEPATLEPETEQLIYYDTKLKEAAETGDLEKLRLVYLNIPEHLRPSLNAAVNRRHKPRCIEIQAMDRS